MTLNCILGGTLVLFVAVVVYASVQNPMTFVVVAGIIGVSALIGWAIDHSMDV